MKNIGTIKMWNIESMTGYKPRTTFQVLNWKIGEHYSGNYRLAEMYDELWRKADQWVFDHFDGDDLQYFLRTTDQENLVFFYKKYEQTFDIIMRQYYYNGVNRKRDKKT